MSYFKPMSAIAMFLCVCELLRVLSRFEKTPCKVESDIKMLVANETWQVLLTLLTSNC